MTSRHPGATPGQHARPRCTVLRSQGPAFRPENGIPVPPHDGGILAVSVWTAVEQHTPCRAPGSRFFRAHGGPGITSPSGEVMLNPP